MIAVPRLHAETKTYLLEGAIDVYTIIMELTVREDNTITGKYFYKSQLRDIGFSGSASGNVFTINVSNGEPKAGSENITETFKLTIGARSEMTGTWRGQKGRELVVELHQLDANKISNPFVSLPYVKGLLKEEESYEYARVALFSIVRDSVKKNGNTRLEYIHIAHTKINMVRIDSGLSPIVTARANEVLLDMLIESASHSLLCDYYKYTFKSLFVYEDVLSINVFIDYNCYGAAHSDYGNEPLTIDLKTGKELELQDVLYFPGSVNNNKEHTLNHNIYGPKMVQLLTKLYPRQMTYKEGENCNYTDPEVWSYAEWFLNKQGLYLLPSFAHAAGVCRDPGWSIIPYSTLKKFANPAYKIELPAQ